MDLYELVYHNVLFMLGGLGIFLFGMKIMGDGLELAAGPKLKVLIEKLTKNKYMGVLVGLITTALIHSSAATTVMIVGLVNTGFMNLIQAASVIMGANIGTAVAALMLAIPFEEIAPVFIFLGVSMIYFLTKNSIKNIGQIISGFGMLFWGISLMSGAMANLGQLEGFKQIIIFLSNPLFGFFAGIVITAIIHSSSAIMGILLSMGGTGIQLSSVIFIIYGQNIGTCITALMASIGTNKTAKRAALIHLLFNTIGSMIFIIITLVLPFTFWIEKLAPGSVITQIPIAHIIFNVLTTAIMLPFSNLMIKATFRLVPGEDEVQEGQKLVYLDDRILKTPSIAISQLLKEVERMANLARNNFKHAMKSFFDKNQKKVKKVYKNEETINFLNRNITTYLVKMNGLDISDKDKKLIGSLFSVLNDIERIGDHCENICELAEMLIDGRADLSATALAEIDGLKVMVESILNDAIFVFFTNNQEEDLIDIISKTENEIDYRTEKFKEAHIERLNRGNCSPISGTIFMELLISLERIADHAISISFSNRRKNTKIMKKTEIVKLKTEGHKFYERPLLKEEI
jgi:phosphate:Na+ symporter